MGATKLLMSWTVIATLSFLVVAALGITILALGYLINLRQANSYLAEDDKLWKSASELYKKVGWLIGISAALMALGIACLGIAAVGFSGAFPSPHIMF